MSTSWTAGVARQGIADPHPDGRVTRPDLCAAHGHPGVTYNSWRHIDKTWCLCGNVVREGDTRTSFHWACFCCADAPLRTPPPPGWELR